MKLAQPDRAAVALVGDGGFSANPVVVATAMEADLPVVWLVMDNAAFGTIAGLEQMHYGIELRLRVRARRPALPRRLRGDGPLVRRATACAIGVGRRARPGARRGARRRSSRPLIQVPMENAPTPTPGHWDINDVYRLGE